jgi:hypothetical protein
MIDPLAPPVEDPPMIRSKPKETRKPANKKRKAKQVVKTLPPSKRIKGLDALFQPPPPYFVISISAPRQSGKSYLIKHLIKTHFVHTYDHIVIMCPSIDLNEDYDELEIYDNVRLISDVTAKNINKLFDEQCACKKRVKKLHKEGLEPRTECPSTLLVLDDCIDSGVINFHGAGDKVAERGRHCNMSVIYSSQRQSAISRSIRLNSNYFISFSPFSVSELEQFLEQFVARSTRKQLRGLIEDIYSVPYQFLILDNNEKDCRLKFKKSITQDFVQGHMEQIYFNESC